MKILICKWHKEMIEKLKNNNVYVAVVLDQYDQDHENIDLKLADGYFFINSFDSIDELNGLGAFLNKKLGKVDYILIHTEKGQ